jgi:hypothetical protein
MKNNHLLRMQIANPWLRKYARIGAIETPKLKDARGAVSGTIHFRLLAAGELSAY